MAKYKWYNKKKSKYITVPLNLEWSDNETFGESIIDTYNWTVGVDGTYTITLGGSLHAATGNITLTTGDAIRVSGSDIYINNDIVTNGYAEAA